MKNSKCYLLILSALFITGCSNGNSNENVDIENIKIEEYNKGYADGLDEGYSNGFEAGDSFGYDDGYTIGKEDGYKEGYTAGSTATQGDAYNDGYNHGLVDGENNALENLTLGIYPGNDIDFHTEKQANYLLDSYSNISKYANGSSNTDTSKPQPIRLKYGRGDAPANATFKILVSERPDFVDAWTYETKDNFVDVYNCKLNTKYYWKLSEINEEMTSYPTFSFTTKDTSIRNLNIGTISNARDLGGVSTSVRLRQGLIYRSAGLNWNALNDSTITPDEETLNILTKQLGVKTDIDLAGRGQVGSLNRIDCKMEYDGNILTDTRNAQAIKQVFKTMTDTNNYPMIYHCTRGRDRTGAIGFVLESLLGISEEDMYRDFLFTNFGPNNYVAQSVLDGFKSTLNTFTGSSLKEKAESYLKGLGITDSEISTIRSILTVH